MAEPTDKSGRGVVHVYTGHGKGKTTAALGAVFRALGWGLRPAVVQFIKGKWQTGERNYAARIPELTFATMGEGFTWDSDDLDRDRRAAQRAFARASELLSSGEHQLVVLDEVTYALNYGFVALAELLRALAARPAHVHVILTGRNAPAELCDAADLVTEMQARKHPFERGLPAQRGIDF